MVVGLGNGTLTYYRRNASDAPALFTELTGSDNPFNNIDVGDNAAPALADVDEDGKIDLVVGESGGTLKYFLNESVGDTITFTPKTAASENPFHSSDFDVGTYSVPRFADISGDGKPDLVVGERDGNLNYYLNESANGTITFTAKTAASDNPFDGFDVGAHSIPIFADISGDGKLDLVVGEEDGNLNYYLNESANGTITFTAKTAASDNPFDGFDFEHYSAPAFAELNGDDKIDLVSTAGNGTLIHYLNESTESTIAFTEQTHRVNLPGSDVQTTYFVPAFADVNGDGKLDFVLGKQDGTLNYYVNESTEDSITWTEKTGGDNPFNGFDVGLASSPTFFDMDGDGDQDLVVGASNGVLNYFRNESVGGIVTFAARTAPFSIDVGFRGAPEFADIDGDGKVDLIAGEQTGVMNYHRNTSTTSSASFTWMRGNSNPFKPFGVIDLSTPAFMDMDGDGDQDLVVGQYNGTLRYYLNESTTGSIVFTQKTGVENPFNSIHVGQTSAPEFADIDGDGDLDLMVGSYDRGLFTFLHHYGHWVQFR